MLEARRIYRLNTIDLDELNRILASIGDRLDQMEGFRGQPRFMADVDFGGNRGMNASPGWRQTDLATVGYVDGKVNPIVDLIYPVGALLITTKSENPSSYLGGSWERYAKGRVLIGIDETDGDFDSLGKMGGAKGHNHNLSGTTGGPSASVDAFAGSGVTLANSTHVHDFSATTNSASNLPPYIAVYIWRRIA
jgi:hypothetical protein